YNLPKTFPALYCCCRFYEEYIVWCWQLVSYVEEWSRGDMSSPVEQLRQAAATGNLDQVRALLKAGVKADPDLEGRTALHLASANGHAAVVKALIEGGAKINALDAAGYSPLHQAATEGHEEVVKLLLKNGCHVDTQDELHGNTALHEAAWKGFSRTVEILCKNRANFYIKNNGGFTPLHLACQNGHNQCCRNLLLAACKPDVRNSQYGDTPLHTAARYGHAGVLRILISAFCNVNEKNKNGDTGLHVAVAMGRSKLTRILLEAGCDQQIRNHQGEMARDIAERKEFTELVKLLDNPPVTLIHVEQETKKHSKSSSKKREKDSHTSQESGEKEKKDKHKKGPRGLGYMCYCAPFFNHVEKKLDANKKELFDHIDSRNEDLKAKINHLEQRTHDQLFSLNQKMKESLALERSECAERIDRRLFRERRELEQQQETNLRKLQTEMKSMLGKSPNANRRNGHCETPLGNGTMNYHIHNGNQPLLRSKSEDLLSETNSNHNSVSLMSSTVTGVSRFTNNSNYQRTFLNPAQCGTKPKVNHISNISSKMRCLGYPELKCESRSEGDLTSCHTEKNEYDVRSPPDGNVNYSVKSPYGAAVDDRQLKSSAQDRWNANNVGSGVLWKNTQYNRFSSASPVCENKSSFLPDTSKSPSSYVTARPTYCTNHNHDPNRFHITDSSQNDHKSQIRTPVNGLQSTIRDGVSLSSNQNGNSSERNPVLPAGLENDGSSFV
ncbi:unnamed protein product, partial [Larinioides sclopetarius]